MSPGRQVERFEALPFPLAAFTRLSRRVTTPGVLRPGGAGLTLKARFNGLKVEGFSRGAGAAEFQSTLRRASPVNCATGPALKRWSSKPSGKVSEDAYLRSWVNELHTASVTVESSD